jgi:Txe/YoeB family toxin of Txe-Axe toxin-antitoxin module
VTWKLVYTKQAQKDAKKLASSGLKPKAQELLTLIAEDPYRKPPPLEKLIGDLAGYWQDRGQP